jgi:peptide deformylase
MAAFIRKFNDPALSTPCEPVLAGDPLLFIADMKAVLRQQKNGVGLAAPQIGVLKAACVIWHQRKGGECIVMLNPLILRASREFVTEKEGCLSYPGVFAPVERHQWVEVAWDDRATGQTVRVFTGFQGRVVQHELDHLDGICRVGDAWRAAHGLPSAGRDGGIAAELAQSSARGLK